VIAICDSTGDIQERYTYDAFGKRNVFDVDFTAKVETEFNWNRAFTGQVIDNETGLMLYRNRYYHVDCGQFINRDLIEYKSGDLNMYRYVNNFPTILLDPDGLKVCGVHVWVYTGSYCVEDNVWNAAMEGAAMGLICGFECEITTHTNINLCLWYC
jgi:RHS repeat-associated protein